MSAEILKQVEERGIETIRVLFTDQHGILHGKTIVASALASAFDKGIGLPSTLLLKDTAHKTVFPVWSSDARIGELPLGGAGNVTLKLDPKRFFPLPWSKHSAIILSDVVDRSGTLVAFSSDAVLADAVAALDKAGYRAIFGLEVEFQVFRVTEPGLAHEDATMPPMPVSTENMTQGSQYLSETRYGEAETLLDDLRRAADELGLEPRTMEIEMGPSQFEFTFAASDPQTQADRFVLFRTLVKEMCHARGLHASFMAKPNLPNAAANGWHMHQSLIDTKTDQPVFVPESDTPTQAASAWIAGLLTHAKACCLMTNPTVNSYKRFTPFQLAPNRIQWGRDNRGAMIRALMTQGDPASRIENRVADTSANPHFAFAAQIYAGLDGLSRGLTAPQPTETPYDEGAENLPRSLFAAIDAFESSDFISASFGTAFVTYLSTLKRAEWDRYMMTVSDWEHREYFGLF